MSISAYLRSCKGILRSVANGTAVQKLTIVVGNESADLDSCVSSIAYGYLQSIAGYADRTVIPVLNLPREDIKLRPELSQLLKSADLLETDLICRDELPNELKKSTHGPSFILVDHNHFKIPGFDGNTISVAGIIDHHVDEGLYQDASPRIIQTCGSCTSLVVKHFSGLWKQGLIESEAQLSKMVLSAILVDTSRLTNQATETDFDVVNLLKSRLLSTQDWNEDDQYKSLQKAKRNNDGLTVRQLLKRDYKEWDLGSEIGLWGISSVTTSLDRILSMDHWQEDVKAHGVDQQLDVHMIMTKHGEKELFIRLVNAEKSQYLQKFMDLAIEQMKLTPWNQGTYVGPELYAFQQGDLSATRKKVATICQAIRH